MTSTGRTSALATTLQANTRHPFSVATVVRDSIAVVELRGELDIAAVPVLIRTLEELAAHSELELDCAKLTFLDAAGLGTLVESTRGLDAPPRLRNASPAVRRLLRLTDTQQLFSPPEDGAAEGGSGQ